MFEMRSLSMYPTGFRINLLQSETHCCKNNRTTDILMLRV